MIMKTLNDFYNAFPNQVNILSQFIPDNILPNNRKSFVDEFIKSRFNNRKLSFYGVFISHKEFNDMSLSLNTTLNELFSDKWTKLVSLENLEYNPLKPFNIELNEQVTDKFVTVKDITNSSGNEETYAFNSVEPTPTDKSTGLTTKQYERDNPRTRNYSRVGNIGNTSLQDLIKQEREISNWVLLDVVIEDIISVVCRKSYALQ